MTTAEVDLRLAHGLATAVGDFAPADLTAAPAAPTRRWLLPVLGATVLGVIVAAAAVRGLGLGRADPPKWLPGKVEKGSLVVTVTSKGTLESAANENIKCRVAGGSKIVEIVENGKYVKKGDPLVTLDSSTLDDQIKLQTITVNKAMASKDQAEKDYEVAQIGVTEYEKGTFLKDIDTAEANVTIAKENLSSAKNSLEHSQRMFRKGYISTLQLEAQEFAVRRAELDLKSATTAKMVLEKFTREKTLTELRTKVQTAKSRMESEQNAFALEKSRLKRLEGQLLNCTVKAPKDGVVVYANEANQRGMQQNATIEQGATIAEGKDILRLPDMSKMQARLLVNETKVGRLQLDQPAVLKIQGDRYRGHITSIANQHEQKGWNPGEIRDYAVIVVIEELISGGDSAEFSLTGKDGKSLDAKTFDKNRDGVIGRNELPDDDALRESFDQIDVNRDSQLDPRDQLKPGMTADAVVTVETLDDVLKIPVTAVVSKGAEHYCWVQQGDGVERRPLTLGRTDDSHYQVKDGVAEADVVVVNPRSAIVEARQIEQQGKIEEAAQRAGGNANGSGPGVPLMPEKTEPSQPKKLGATKSERGGSGRRGKLP